MPLQQHGLLDKGGYKGILPMGRGGEIESNTEKEEKADPLKDSSA